MKENVFLVGETPKGGPDMPLGTARRLTLVAEQKLNLSWLAIGDAVVAIIFYEMLWLL